MVLDRLLFESCNRQHISKKHFKIGTMNSDNIKLSREILQKAATEQSFERGEEYYECSMVESPIREGNTIRAEVTGSGMALYNTEICLEPPFHTRCTCPYDWGGICKHIVALGLTWINSPDSFPRMEEKKEEVKSELEQVFAGLGRDELAEMLYDLISRDENLRLKALDWIKDRDNVVGQPKLQMERLMTLMDYALETVREFNAYGGGPEEDEIECCDYMYEMSEILSDENFNIPSATRKDIITRFMEWYQKGNSGLGDPIREVIFSAAISKQEWELVIEGLEATGSDFDRDTIMQIYLRELEEEETYLKLRTNDLVMGMDYYDLAMYYHERGEKDEAARIAQQGVEKGDGRIRDNIVYLKNYYLEREDTEKAVEYALQEFEERPSLECYKFVLDSCQDSEREGLRSKMIRQLEEKNSWLGAPVLASIYAEEKQYDRVMNLVEQNLMNPGEYEDLLCKKYPEKMIAYYDRQVQEYIERKNRKSYAKAAKMALNIRGVYKKVLKDTGKWGTYLNPILKRYLRRYALQEEFSRICK